MAVESALNLEIVKLLLSGADVNIETKTGCSIIFLFLVRFRLDFRFSFMITCTMTYKTHVTPIIVTIKAGSNQPRFTSFVFFCEIISNM